MSEQPQAEEGLAPPELDVPVTIEYRPLTIRMRDDVRAQLDVLAQLNERTVTEETRLALEHWVEKAKSDPSLKERADRVRSEIDRDAELRRQSIDRDAAARRSAIEAVLNGGDAGDLSSTATSATKRTSTSKKPSASEA